MGSPIQKITLKCHLALAKEKCQCVPWFIPREDDSPLPFCHINDNCFSEELLLDPTDGPRLVSLLSNGIASSNGSVPAYTWEDLKYHWGQQGASVGTSASS